MKRETIVPSLPDIRQDNTLEVLRAIKSTLDVREGSIGDPLDQNVTLRDLTDLNLVLSGGVTTRQAGGSLPVSPVLPPTVSGYNPATDFTVPPAPTNLRARGGFTNVYLEWDGAPYRNHSYTEIWRASADNLGQAVLVGTTAASLYADPAQPDTTYYYWIRFVSRAAVVGPYNQTSGTQATTALDVGSALAAISSTITSSPLFRDLGSRISAIESDAYIQNLTSGAYKSELDQLSAGVASASSQITSLRAVNTTQAVMLTELSTTSGAKTRTFFQASAPVNSLEYTLAKGDVWYDTDDNNKSYRWSGSAWVAFATSTRVFYQASAPGSTAASPLVVGDLWYDSDDNNKPHRWNGTAWETLRDGFIDARVTTLEQTKIGYATLNATGLVFDNNGAITDKATTDAWNADNPGNPATWHIGLPFATAVKQVGVTEGDETLTLEQRFTAQRKVNGDLFGQYTIKIDNAGHIAGFGLASTGGKAAPTSDFGVRADKFWIAGPATAKATPPTEGLYKGFVWIDTSVTPNVTRYYTGSAWTTTAPTLPFVVNATPTTVNGKTYPAGVWIDTGFIATATITTAQITDLTADKITAGSLSAALGVSTGKIWGGVAVSSNKEDGTFGTLTKTFGSTQFGTGFFLGADGDKYKFYVGSPDQNMKWDGSALSVTGTLNAVAGSFRNITVYGDQDRVILSSGGVPIAGILGLAGSGTNICNPRYSLFKEAAKPPTADGGGTSSLDPDVGYFGGASLRLTPNSYDNYAYLGGTGADFNFPLASGQTYIVSGYVRCSSPSVSGEFFVRSNGVNGTHHNIAFTTSPSANTWTRVSGTITAATGATLGLLRVDNNGGPGVIMWFDGLMIEPAVGSSTTPSPFVAPPNFLSLYTGDLSATRNQVQSGSLSALPTGSDGDFYYATDSYTLYQKVAGSWVISGTVGAPAGTLVNGVAVANITSAVSNFNSSNDRNGDAITAPTVVVDGSAVDHTLQTDGSADISFEWVWGSQTDKEGDIDGFQVFVYQSSSSTAYGFGTTPAAEMVYEVPANKRAFILFGVTPNLYYTFGVRAYRAVDKDIDATGYIVSAMAKPTLSGENPYRPSTSVAFAGDVTGTVNSIAVTDLNVWSKISGTGKPADGATKNAVFRQAAAPTAASGPWVASTSYALNALVDYGAQIYSSLYSGNVGQRPDTSPGAWTLIGPSVSVNDIWFNTTTASVSYWNGASWVLAGDVTANNTAKNIAGQGVLAKADSVFIGSTVKMADGTVLNTGDFVNSLTKIGSGNIATFIDGAAITDAYIGSLNASKITAGTISADRIGAGSITATKIDSAGLEIKDAKGNVILRSGSTPINSAPTFSVVRRWDFDGSTVNANTVDGFAFSQTTVTASGSSIFLTSTGSDPQLYTPPGLNIDGSAYNKIQVRIKRTGGTGWDSLCVYSTNSHGISGSYYKSIPDGTLLNTWVTLEWDMAALTGGGSDWTNSTIQQIRMDFGASSADTFEIDWIAIGRYSSAPVHQITPDNASTFIKALSVDTLQIAGEAVLVPRTYESSATYNAAGTILTYTWTQPEGGKVIVLWQAQTDSARNFRFKIYLNAVPGSGAPAGYYYVGYPNGDYELEYGTYYYVGAGNGNYEYRAAIPAVPDIGNTRTGGAFEDAPIAIGFGTAVAGSNTIRIQWSERADGSVTYQRLIIMGAQR